MKSSLVQVSNRFYVFLSRLALLIANPSRLSRAFSLLCGCLLLAPSSSGCAAAQSESLKSLVINAQLNGGTEVTTGSPRIYHRVASSVEDELSESLVILARVDASYAHLVESQPYVFTTYRLHVLEVLSSGDNLSSFSASDPVHSLQPYEVDLTEAGGVTRYKGVAVKTHFSEGRLADGQTYLFFLDKDPGCGRCYHRTLGAAGAAHVDTSSHIDSVGKDALSTELHDRFSDDYQVLKKSLRITPR